MGKYDLLIRGGAVLDGSGSKPVITDIGVVDDRIAAMGDLSKSEASKILNVDKMHIAPGFIDMHTHSDISALFHPEQESMISQGVTTQVVGNCALCIGMATDAEPYIFEKRWLGLQGIKITWKSLEQNLQRITDNGIATNYLTLAGQGTLRKGVMGQEDRPPDREEMNKMKAALEAALEQGAWGISTGLEYTPSSYADVNELAELSSVVGKYGGFYASHLRNEGDFLEDSVSEAIEIGERAGIPIQLSHHKAEGRRNWGKVHKTLHMVDMARARGVDVQMDQYPYDAFQTGLSVQLLPPWVVSGTNQDMISRLEDHGIRKEIIEEIRANHSDWNDTGENSVWDSMEIANATDSDLHGRSIGELARARGEDPLEYALNLIAGEKNFISAINHAIGEQDIVTVLQHPMTMIGSDAVGSAAHGKISETHVHPRCYGTFTRILGLYVRERAVLQEAEAVRKMTTLPADRLGIKDRGRLIVGNYADIVVYNPKTVRDNATYAKPHAYSTGIEWTIVNGRIVWGDSTFAGKLPGKVLKRAR